MNYFAKNNKQQQLYLAGSIICCVLFVFLAIAVKSHTSNLYFNVYLYQYVETKLQISFVSYLAIFVSLFGDKFVVIPTIILTSVVLFLKQQKRFALHFFAVILVAALLAFFLKNILAVPRPGAFAYVANKYAFPSRHVLLFSACLVFLYAVIPQAKGYKWLKIIMLFLFIALESLSRIVLGVHWLTDVIGGFLLGTTCGLMGAYCFNLKPEPIPNRLLFKTMIFIFCIISIAYLSFVWSELIHEYRIDSLHNKKQNHTLPSKIDLNLSMQ